LVEVNTRQAAEIVSAAIDTKESVLLLGTPGIGKTEIIETQARKRGIGFRFFEAPSLDPTDIRGVLIPQGDRSVFTKSALLPDPKEHGEDGVLLIDEITSGLPAVQVALHPLFHPKERRLGNDRLPEGWVPMATGNYATDGAGARALLTALSDRITTVHVRADFQVWKEDYAIPNNIHPIVIGLLNFRPDLFDTFEKRDKQGKGKTFASPRSHTSVSKTLYYHDNHPLTNESLLATLAGKVGEGVAAEYVGFMKVYLQLPDVLEIYAGKDIIPKEPSVLYALTAAMVAKIPEVAEKKGLKNTIDRLMEFSLKMDSDFGGLMIRDAYSLYRKEILSSKLWVTVAKRYF